MSFKHLRMNNYASKCLKITLKVIIKFSNHPPSGGNPDCIHFQLQNNAPICLKIYI
jgi:hypothetical protein